MAAEGEQRAAPMIEGRQEPRAPVGCPTRQEEVMLMAPREVAEA